MSKTTTIVHSCRIDLGTPVSTTETITTDGVPNYNLTVLGGVTNQIAEIAFLVANLRAYFITSNQTVTMNVNGTDEIQTVTIGGGASGGTFLLIWSGQTTGTIAWNATAAVVQAALEALSNIGTGNVSVSGSAGGPWSVTFLGTLGVTDVAAMTYNLSGLTGGVPTITIATPTPGVAPSSTFTLQANIPMVWSEQEGNAVSLFTVDVNQLRFTNAGTAQANINIILPLDV